MNVIITKNGAVHKIKKNTTYYTDCNLSFDDYAKRTKLPITCKKCLNNSLHMNLTESESTLVIYALVVLSKDLSDAHAFEAKRLVTKLEREKELLNHGNK